MKQDIIIQYDTAKLKEQHDIICASRMKAFQKVIGDAYVRTLVLKQDDPPELWRFAFGKCGSLTPLTHKEKQMAKGISARLRQLDPQFTGTTTATDAGYVWCSEIKGVNMNLSEKMKNNRGQENQQGCVGTCGRFTSDDDGLCQHCRAVLDEIEWQPAGSFVMNPACLVTGRWSAWASLGAAGQQGAIHFEVSLASA